ncbi:hypothetical protein SDRG_11170 [Saprolegnia diclina VS20]|uniref:Calcineurin-like phosphoesterase domain-containing protein n=1 Tax=Saprolegnia diclina (strain VS20) TaxID=1156394 RepID=T0Q075_SAPDV|nr:hypothetical protein SDRG_11170 [Saprolegnia diclina VS20]EQC31249.1 hypothetical protein SDRG_11170 [Saprolegnia diclina VS20]|eukprot:XP_008615422.1 hypothetical protein SDRG_11170 [Saprolegnia diclina VS20]
MAARPRAHPDVALPRTLHATHHVPIGARVVIVGDVHGCLDEVHLLLAACAFAPAHDVLIFVGDLVNKGPQSAEVVRFVRTTGALCVRGNHDDAALSAYYGRRTGTPETSIAAFDTRYDYVADLSPDDIAFLEQLPFSIALPELDTLVVHAGVVPNIPLEAQVPQNLYKMRYLIPPSSTNEAWAASEAKPETGGLWAPQYNGPPFIVFGHDAKAGLQECAHALGLDTGCCYGRELSAVILPERRVVSVPALKMHCVPNIPPPTPQ